MVAIALIGELIGSLVGGLIWAGIFYGLYVGVLKILGKSREEETIDKHHKYVVYSGIILGALSVGGSLLMAHWAPQLYANSSAVDYNERVAEPYNTTNLYFNPLPRYKKEPETEDRRKDIVQFVGDDESITIKSVDVSMTRSQFYNASWSDVISNYEDRGFTHTGGPNTVRIGEKRYIELRFMTERSGIEMDVIILTTFHEGQQFLFVFTERASENLEGYSKFKSYLSDARYK